jgi:IS1 family transposase
MCGGKRELKTAQELRKRIKGLGISYDRIGIVLFLHLGEDRHEVGIEGNNCRIRRAFRRTCCFSKKLYNHLKAYDMAFLHQLWLRLITHHTFWITSLVVFSD